MDWRSMANQISNAGMESVNSVYKLTFKYGGYFKEIKDNTRLKYHFGKQKSIIIDTDLYNKMNIEEDLSQYYSWGLNQIPIFWSMTRTNNQKSFVEIRKEEDLTSMFNEYRDLKKYEIYVTLADATPISIEGGWQKATDLQENDRRETLRSVSNDSLVPTQASIDANQGNINMANLSTNEEQVEEDCAEDVDLAEQIESETSYHSLYSSESDDESGIEEDKYQIDSENPSIKIGSLFVDCYQFRRALEQYSILKEFCIKYIKSDQSRVTARCADYKCSWRVHASIVFEQGVFQVKTMQEEHSCCSVKKCGNKMATQHWIANKVSDWLRREGDLSAKELRRRLNEKYNVDLPYHRVWRGKEEAMSSIHGNWEESYMKITDFKDKLMRRNPGSIVNIDKESMEGKSHFKRIFICLGPCSTGFLLGCRPFLGLDGCHLKGKYKGVMAAASAIDGCNRLFPVAYGILESENIESWTWFLNGLYEAIGLPNGLVLASDRQKGLEEAICRVYPSAEHKTCVRHMYKNFKNKFHGESLQRSIWAAARS